MLLALTWVANSNLVYRVAFNHPKLSHLFGVCLLILLGGSVIIRSVLIFVHTVCWYVEPISDIKYTISFFRSMESKTIYTQATLLIAVSVGVWWAANSITAVSSKSFMRGASKPDINSWSDAILDFRWLELTTLQHLIGAVVSIAWLKTVGKTVWPSEASKKIILLASLGNVAGNMATNAAYAMVSSSMTQVVKACEPLFMFGLSLLLYKDYQVLNSATLLSIVIMVIGASLFVAYDSTFLVSGLLAALCSNVAFPIRNIYLKKLSSVWESSFQKYAVISIYSVLVLTPLVVVKMLLFQSFAFAKKWGEGFVSASCHCTYNIASIYVLQNFTPLTHAILNLLKRGIVIGVNLVYFQLPLSWKMVLGLGLLFAGLYLYVSKGKKFPLLSVALVIAVVVGIVLLIPQKTEMTQVIENKVNLELSPRLKLSQSVTQKSVLHKDDTFQQHSVINKTSSNLARVAWVFDRPLSKKILSNIQTLSTEHRLLVYCGTTHCMQAINDLSNENISTSFLLINELVQDTPFENWLARHMFYKVLAMEAYEDHLQEVVRLAILWSYGGLYFEPNVQLMTKSLPACSSDSEWVGKNPVSDGIQHFDIACLPKQAGFTKTLSKMFAEEYLPENSVKPKMNVDEKTWNSYFSKTKLPEIVDVKYDTLSLSADQSWNNHYATLDYHTTVRRVSTDNQGDEIQGYPGLQFLPFIDSFLDRDALYSNKNNDQHITAFFNAWWGYDKSDWPPQSNVDPLLFSIHVFPRMKPLWEREADYLKPKAPIGCRDTSTVDFLTNLGVPSYFSGCFTVMYKPLSLKPRTNDVLVVDVGRKFYDMLPDRIRNDKRNHFSHDIWGNSRYDRSTRFIEAFKKIERYSTAKLVITQRIHTALPCVALNTPVLFINSAGMPGGGGTVKSGSDRTTGLLSMFHTMNAYQIEDKDMPDWFANFPWDNPPPNPDMATHMRLRATFWYETRKRPSLYDAGLKFGVVPMSPPTPCVDREQFHIHFPHPDDHFTWQDHRSVESIFRHHPCASVLVHSNTLNDERFSVFRESGYVIQTQTYDHRSFIKPATGDLTEQLISNTYLVRALVLLKWGGVYMDSNIILTKSIIIDLPRNFIVWRDSSKREVDSSFMRFEKGNKFLESVAAKFAADPDNQGDGLYTEALQKAEDKVETIDSRTVFVFDNAQVNKQCYEVTSGPEYDSWSKTIAESAAAVALSSDYSVTQSIGTTPLKEGTLCRKLLYDFCVICSVLL